MRIRNLSDIVIDETNRKVRRKNRFYDGLGYMPARATRGFRQLRSKSTASEANEVNLPDGHLFIEDANVAKRRPCAGG